MQETSQRLAPTSVLLHWLVAVFIIVLLAVGFYMDANEVRALYPIHKSFGMVVFVLALLRVLWRLAKGFPPPAARYQPWEQTLATIVHWVLLIGTLLFPLSGMIMSAMGGNGLAVFGVELFPMNPDPLHPGKNMPIDKAMAGNARAMHGILAWVMLGAIALHVAGALKHHLIDGDGTLRRMLGRTI